MGEKELIESYIQKLYDVNTIEEELKEAKKDLADTKNKIIEYLSDREQTATGKYEGLGSLSLKNFITFKVDEASQDQFMDFIKQNGYESVIKQSIHHKTLDRIMGELIEEGKAIPEYVSSYTVTNLQLNKG